MYSGRVPCICRYYYKIGRRSLDSFRYARALLARVRVRRNRVIHVEYYFLSGRGGHGNLGGVGGAELRGGYVAGY